MMENGKADDDTYVYLNFDGRVNQLMKETSYINFRMYNVDTASPIVQVNEHFYQGEYDEAMGTNIYFSEMQNGVLGKKDPCKPNTPIALTYLINQRQVLNLKRIGSLAIALDTQQSSPTRDKPEHVKIFFNDNYWGLIEAHKGDRGLNIEDYVVSADSGMDSARVQVEGDEKEKESGTTKPLPPCNELELPPSNRTTAEWYANARYQHNTNATFLLYLQLQELAKESQKFRMLGRTGASVVVSYKQRYKCKHAQHNAAKVKRLFIRHFAKSMQFLHFNTNELRDFVDVEQSIKDGTISGNHSNGEFSPEHLQALLSITNFKNLSFWMKFIIITDAVIYYENRIAATANANLRELFQKDVDGFSLLEKYDIFHIVRTKVIFLIKKRLSSVDNWQLFNADVSSSGQVYNRSETIRRLINLKKQC